MSLTDAWLEWKEWIASLSPEFAFLLALPFLVALAALLKLWLARSRAGAPDRNRPASDAGSRNTRLVA